jgi:hypothetical protein
MPLGYGTRAPKRRQAVKSRVNSLESRTVAKRTVFSTTVVEIAQESVENTPKVMWRREWDSNPR